MLGYNSVKNTSFILLENTPLNAVHEWTQNRLKHQTDTVLHRRSVIFSQGASDNHESAPVVIGNCSPSRNSRCTSSVSWPQTGWLQAVNWPPSNQHTAITGTKAEPTFIRKHNRSPLRPPMSSNLTPLMSQTAVVWSQWNARYRSSGSELSLK
ncbi:hypothetical protein AVEN_247699-1 [Araneus ventricosus]|uniref:Uncharacterized protein n=1 Tax=Araneus ventricosus TaxID=182803 RepID=A0A4Y2GMY1_ARAVE|nr:hypothetical protein AVEN_247699-1 [Araneus ventricosus]